MQSARQETAIEAHGGKPEENTRGERSSKEVKSVFNGSAEVPQGEGVVKISHPAKGHKGVHEQVQNIRRAQSATVLIRQDAHIEIEVLEHHPTKHKISPFEDSRRKHPAASKEGQNERIVTDIEHLPKDTEEDGHGEPEEAQSPQSQVEEGIHQQDVEEVETISDVRFLIEVIETEKISASGIG